MRRSFRVATVFTGAAAAVATFTPAAGAAPITPLAPAAADAHGQTCSSVVTSDLVLWYKGSTHHPACVSGRGFVGIGDGNARFSQYCAGEYSGYLWVSGERQPFTKGIHHLYGQKVSAVSITKSNHLGSQCIV